MTNASTCDFVALLKRCLYTSCYCEENVWWLCKELKDSWNNELNDCFVVFISNSNRTVPLWNQKAAQSPENPVIWDYHVIVLLRTTDRGWLVLDNDSTLDAPSTFESYSAATFRSDLSLKREYHRYLCDFASDRSHMKKSDGSWYSEPPKYPPICTSQSTNNLDSYRQISGNSIPDDTGGQYGVVLSLAQLNLRFGMNR